MNIKIKSVLFLGIGGVSMHQLALAFKSLGVKVYGYDAKKNQYTAKCEEQGIIVTNKFVEEYCGVDLCVKTGAIKSSKYITRLKKINCPILDRADALAWMCNKFKNVIAVAGTHGKSTTASLIYEILRAANKRVSCHIGADVFLPRFNFDDDIIIVEACEFNKSFLSLNPTVSVVTNVEAEHLDSYGNLFNLQTAFMTFLKRAKTRFVYSEKSTQFIKKLKAVNFVKSTEKYASKLYGEYNQKNIALAVAVAKFFDVDEKIIKQTIARFAGIPRRFELIGTYKQNKVYIDYAHHPTELKAFISTFVKINPQSQIIFQPHTFSRTKYFFDEFVSVLKNVKNLILYKEYPAREKSQDGKSAYDLYCELKKQNDSVEYCANIKKLTKKLAENACLAFVGAGDINQVAHKFVKSN